MRDKTTYTKIVAGFPGTGKSYCFLNGYRGMKLADSDSSQFSWILEDGKKVRNPNFIQDYIQHIKEQEKINDFVFVSTHSIVLDAMRVEGMRFVVVVPDASLYGHYIDRYVQRGNDEAFINMMEVNFVPFIQSIERSPDTKIRLTSSDNNMRDALDHLLVNEYRLAPYKGYSACFESVDDDTGSGFFLGRITDIEDTITFKADSIADMENEFHVAVDEYIEDLTDTGRTPLTQKLMANKKELKNGCCE